MRSLFGFSAVYPLTIRTWSIEGHASLEAGKPRALPWVGSHKIGKLLLSLFSFTPLLPNGQMEPFWHQAWLLVRWVPTACFSSISRKAGKLCCSGEHTIHPGCTEACCGMLWASTCDHHQDNSLTSSWKIKPPSPFSQLAF